MEIISKFQTILAKLQQWKKQLTPKKIVTILVITLLCILPLIMASLYVRYYDYIHQTNHFSVSLYDKNGAELVSEEGSPETAIPGSMVDLFYQLNTKKSPLAKPAGNPDTDDFIIARVALNDSVTDLKCYFSRFHDRDGYCIDQTGKTYTIPTSINDLFLLSTYGELFYSNATIPTLTTIDEDRILPSEVNWYYQAVDGEYLKSTDNEIAESRYLYEITGTIGIQFDLQPDTCTISITDSNGNLLKKDCTLADLPSVAVNTGSLLTMQIQAEWLSSEDRDFYGTVNYSFDIKLRNPSTFSIHKTTVTAGEFLLISCTNISTPSKINTLVNNEARTVKFFSKETSAFGILPIPRTVDAQTMSLQFSYGASKQDFEISIEKATSVSVSKPDWEGTPQWNNAAELNALLASFSSAKITPLYFQGNFLSPEADGFTVEYTHGCELLYGEDQTPMTPYGTEFVTASTNPAHVKALNHGTVIQAGYHPSIGTFVVLDHGSGLRTVYGALSNASVEVGQAVQKGDILGNTSEKTRSGKNGFLLLCAVNTTLIDPTYIIGKNITFPAS